MPILHKLFQKTGEENTDKLIYKTNTAVILKPYQREITRKEKPQTNIPHEHKYKNP